MFKRDMFGHYEWQHWGSTLPRALTRWAIHRFVPLRLSVAYHVLRGRPTIAFTRFDSDTGIRFSKANRDLLIAGCRVMPDAS